MQIDVCQTKFIDEKAVAHVKKHLRPENEVLKVVESLKLLSDLSRLKILQALSVKELCVCDIACLFGISESATSHQLRILRNAKIVKYRKEGKAVYYSLSDNHIKTIVNSFLQHATHETRQTT